MYMIRNPKSILFLYEGETEGEFYKHFFDSLPQRSIRINWSNLKGVYGLNDKVRSKIHAYLQNHSFKDSHHIHVFVAYDREGERHVSSILDTSALVKEFVECSNSRICEINEIIATQDLESWMFHDLAGIYKFLQTPKPLRNLKAYPNVEATNNYTLSALFHRNKKHYQKGRRVEGFLKSLDLKLIFSKVSELEEAKKKILSLMN